MFEFSDLKQTRVYREAKEEGRLEGIIEGRLEAKLEAKLEGKLESVPRLFALGLTLEQIAQVFSLSVEQVREAAQNYLAE